MVFGARVHAARVGTRKRLTASAVIVAVAATLVVPTFALPAAAATGTLSGTVFDDYNADGVLGVSPAEPGVAGAVVYAYDTAGARFGPATTNSSGVYSLSVNGAAAGALRVELTTIPSGYQPSRAGSSSVTTIRFVNPWTGGNVANLNYGIQKPGEYCQNNPDIATTVFCVGNGTHSSGNPGVIYHSTYNSATRTIAATATAAGSVDGVAWDPVSKSVFVAAYVKRHAGLVDTWGADAIYKMNPATNTTTHWVDLATLGIDVGQGSIPTNAARNITSASLFSQDPIFGEVGKYGIGDIETNGTDTLFVTNLYGRTVHAIPIPVGAGTPTTSTSLGLPGSAITCTNGTARPFALTFQDGFLYAGVVCDAATGTTADLDAYVVRRDPGAGGTWAQFGPRIDLDYNKGPVYTTADASNTSARNKWHVWDDTIDANWDGGLNSSAAGNADFIIRPTPMLSDIEFDDDGSMVLAFRDRTGDMIGADAARPDAADSDVVNPFNYNSSGSLVFAMSGGDVLRVCNVSGSWVIDGATSSCANHDEAGAVANTGQGANNGEFYAGDGNGAHQEVSQGHLALAPRTGQLLLSSLNAVDNTFNSGGIRGLSNSNGTRIDALTANYYTSERPASGQPRFGKANGMGDLEALCDAAPLEIGNRVWLDANGNGVQDAGETGIDGVTVQLFAATDTTFTTVLGTAVTSGGGQYYFRTGLTEAANGGASPDNIGGGLNYRTAYVIRVGSTANYQSGGPLYGYLLSPANQTVVTTPAYAGNADELDSDALAGVGAIGSAWRPTLAVPATNPGFNNHSYDVGFMPVPVRDLALRKTVLSMNGTPSSGSVTFQIEIFNQTVDPVNGVTITDYIDTASFLPMTALPAGGTTGGSAALSYAWDNTSTTNPTVTISGVIPGNSSVTLPVTLTIASSVRMAGLRNWAEITRFDTDGNPANGDSSTGAVYDVDSIPDATNTDALVDDEISLHRWTNTATSQTENTSVLDEDDHDIATVPVYDLALIKKRSAGQQAFITSPAPSPVSFDVTVKNQGQFPAYRIRVTDTVASGLALSASNATANISGHIVTYLGAGVFEIDSLAAGETLTFPVLTTATTLTNNVLVNTAEISSFDNDSNGANALPSWVQDMDSTPDAIDNDAIQQNGTVFPIDSHNNIDNAPINGINALDEDDHDKEGVTFALLRLGSTVYIDANGNDVGDAGEGVSGVLVQLLNNSGTVIASTITDANGNYSFDRLLPGTYRVGIPGDQSTATTPAALVGYEPVPGSVANPEANNFDNDGAAAPGWLSISDDVVLTYDSEPTNDGADEAAADALTSPRTYTDANSNLNIDFVFNQITYELGNLIWSDTGAGSHYNNGVADDDESGLSGVTVELYRDNGAGLGVAGDGVLHPDERIATTTTNGAGFYDFTGLVAADDYIVHIPVSALPLGYGASGTPIDVPSAYGVDNDNNAVVDGSTGWSSGAIELGNGDLSDEPTGEKDGTTGTTASPPASVADDRADQTVDFGFVPSVRIGNQVWRDESDNDPTSQVATDNNGQFDAGEMGLAGVTVELWLDANTGDGAFARGGADGATPLATIVTNAEGNYWFDGVRPDLTYFVVIPSISSVALDRPTSSGYTSSNATGSDNDDDGAPLGSDLAVSSPITPTLGGATLGEQDTVEPGDGVGFADANAEDEANAAGADYDDADSELAVDFGFVNVPVYRVGNLVWLDNGGDGVDFDAADENNGIADVGEPGIAGVEVQLFAASDLTLSSPIATATTDADGKYAFENLVAGDYRIKITDASGNATLLSGLTSSPDGASANADIDNDDNGVVVSGGWASSAVSLGAANAYMGGEPTNETLRNGDLTADDDGNSWTATTLDPPTYANNRSNFTVDFGFAPVYRVGNLVWFDTNNDGVAQVGESGMPGVTVELFDTSTSAVLSTVTDSNGFYSFEGIPAGDYVVRVVASTLPAGFVPGGIAVSNADSDVDNDNNAAGSAPYFGASVTLSAQAEPADETVRDDSAADDDNDSFADNLSNYSVDFGFWGQLRLGNTVWHDESDSNPATYVATDNNGVMDAGESPLAGVSVTLWRDGGDGTFDTGVGAGDDTYVGLDFTDAEGNYLFEHLAPGNYFVAIESLPGYVSSLGQQPLGASADNDDNGAGAVDGLGSPFVSVSNLVSLAAGTAPTLEADALPAGDDASAEAEATGSGPDIRDTDSDLTIDLGLVLVPSYRIGNLVWADLNRNGIADSGEPGIEGVLVQLKDSSGTVINETVTDANGAYQFTADSSGNPLLQGDYSVRIPAAQTETLGLGLTIAPGALANLSATTFAGDPDAVVVDNDSNGDPVPGGWESPLVTLGGSSTTFETEPTIEVLRSGGDDDLGWIGGTDARSEFTVDFGFFPGLRLGDTVWYDDGRTGPGTYNFTQADDGIYQATELPAAGVDVLLFVDDGDGVFEPGADDGAATQTASTDSDGEYFFTGLSEDVSYWVAIPASEQGSGQELENWRASTPVFGDGAGTNDRNHGTATAGYAAASPLITLTRGGMAYGDAADEPNADDVAKSGVTVADGDSNLVVDFGFSPEPRYELGNLVWLDVNDNGIAESTESGIAGVTVSLYKDDGDGVFEPGVGPGLDGPAVATDVTGNTGDDLGRYEFTDLDSGSYFVFIGAQSALTGKDSSTTRVADANNDVDNDNNAIPAGTGGWVSGLVELGAISPKGEDDEPINEVDATTGASAEDGSVADWRSNQTVDFGFSYRVRIGNQLWRDESDSNPATHVATDNNGVFDLGETGLVGVSVELWHDVNGDGFQGPASDDVLSDSVVTDAEGNYLFENVLPGDGYYVAVPTVGSPFSTARSSAGQSAAFNSADNDDDGAPLGGYLAVSKEIVATVGTATLGEADTVEPSGDTSAETEADAASGHYRDQDSFLDVDFGFIEVPLYRLGNLVWLDVNNNGIADAGEPPLEGVLVQLLSGSTVVAEAVTDVNGEYLFENLVAGDYSVRIPSAQVETLGGSLSIDSTALVNLASSTTDAATADVDNDDDGLDVTAGWQSAVVTLGDVSDDANTETEPTNEVNRNGGDDDLGWAGGTDARGDLTVDFGFYELLRIGDTVWLDNGGSGGGYDPTLEDNGVYDTAVEGPIAGVTVQLWSDGGNGVFDAGIGVGADDVWVGDSLPTDAAGNYFFTGLTEGTYFASIADGQGALANLRSSTGQASDDSVNDRDQGEPALGFASVSHPIVLVAGAMSNGDSAFESRADTKTGFSVSDSSSNLAIDFGFSPVPTYALGNLVWEDYNDNGAADDGEPGIGDITVELYLDTNGNGTLEPGVGVGLDGAPVATTTTNATVGTDLGRYRFEDLPAGDYIVHIPAQSGLDGWHSGGTPVAVADSGNSIGADNDNNAIVDAANDGWTAGAVTLGGAAGPADNDEPVGETDTVDSPATDAEALVSIRDDRSNQTVDFGFWRGLRLGNQLWLDEGVGGNQDNGVYDSDEAYLTGVDVEIWRDGGDATFDAGAGDDVLVDTTTTGTNGRYFFEHLVAGDYFVAIPTAPTGTVSSTGAPGAAITVDGQDAGEPALGYAAVSELLTLTTFGAPLDETDGPGATSNSAEDYADGITGPYLDASSYLTIDFGVIEVPIYRIGNRVWHDDNNNGLAESGESGIDGVLVQLTDAAGTVLAETVTASGGFYEFTNLVAGDYRVQIPTDQVPVDSGLIASIDYSVIADSHASTVYEVNADGHVDNDSNGVPTGALTRSSVVSLTGSEPVTEQLRVDDATDDDLGQTTPRIDDDRSDYTVDFGFYAISLGNLVFTDVDGDGVFEPGDGDAGVDGVTVNLRLGDGTLVATQVTDADGLYLFTGLVDGETYYVEIPATEFAVGGPLNGWYSSIGDGGDIETVTVDGLDRGVDPSTLYGAVRSHGAATVSATGEPVDDGLGDNPDNDAIRPDAAENLTVDFGFYRMELGGTVFVDSDNDGIDTDEGDFQDVTVLLFNSDGSPFLRADGSQASVQTDSNGDYRFADLPAGAYFAQIPASEFSEELGGWANSDGNDPVPSADNDVTGEDNGYPTSGDIFSDGDVRSTVVTLAPDSEPTDDPTESSGYTDAMSNLSVDFGFWHAQVNLEIGNQLWFDDNEDGIFDIGVELPVPAGVVVRLMDADTGAILHTTLTDSNGQYKFTGLVPGNYRVGLDALNFQLGGLLYLYTATDGAGVSDNPDDALDSDSNGIPHADGSVWSAVLALRASTPVGEIDAPSVGLDDRQSNLTVDFGLIRDTVLASTGYDPMAPGRAALAMLVFGFALLAWQRRRRNAQGREARQ